MLDDDRRIGYCLNHLGKDRVAKKLHIARTANRQPQRLGLPPNRQWIIARGTIRRAQAYSMRALLCQLFEFVNGVGAAGIDDDYGIEPVGVIPGTFEQVAIVELPLLLDK